MFDLDYEFELRNAWLEEARREARQENPLRGYCRRVYFERKACKRRKGHPKAGTQRKYRTHEVELLKFLPSGRCVQVKDLHTKGLDSLAEEIFADRYIPPHTNAAQLFLDYFRQL